MEPICALLASSFYRSNSMYILLVLVRTPNTLCRKNSDAFSLHSIRFLIFMQAQVVHARAKQATRPLMGCQTDPLLAHPHAHPSEEQERNSAADAFAKQRQPRHFSFSCCCMCQLSRDEPGQHRICSMVYPAVDMAVGKWASEW